MEVTCVARAWCIGWNFPVAALTTSWPTIPQVYVDGQFVGGSDILMQLHESGELGELLAQPSEASE